MSKRHYDLAIVGSGAGAFSAAIAARDRDLSVVLIERGTVGGTCVNVGCIPSKALLAAAETRHRAATAAFPGIRTEAGPVDMTALISGKDEIVDGLRRDKYIELLDRHGIEFVRGHASFVDGPALDVEGASVSARAYLIATGSAPHLPDVPGLADSGYLTSTTAMELAELPRSLIVLGGGYVALEQAQLFAHLGTHVTIVARSQIARGEEPEIAEALRDALLVDGITILENTAISEVRRHDDEIVVSTDGGDLPGERVLVATGRRPQTAGLGLAAIGVQTGDRGQVLVGDDLRSTNPLVWAAGDVTGQAQFVYVAARHGSTVVANAFEDAGRQIDYRAMPRITFTNPTMASAGLTEAQAQSQGVDTDSRTLDIGAVPRAVVSRSTRGLVKLVAERNSGRVIGVHLLADGAGDTILAAVYAVQSGMTVTQMADSWNPYLTIGEALHLAAQAFTRDPAALSCCA